MYDYIVFVKIVDKLFRVAVLKLLRICLHNLTKTSTVHFVLFIWIPLILTYLTNKIYVSHCSLVMREI